ncbi:hypothetical protein [Halocynthiibacter styelae]|uniref:Uncharacterized protein n=1 Tax=Halocynthiibacter styelae TaxID=2761955 RepID=A0A8J7LKE4_9RHOB|nr:hypothetical protein [Paenihalocynthiibacter styelae]MBI1492444.1 hypothetical protein [Paenihalocynthiibacter styelae]
MISTLGNIHAACTKGMIQVMAPQVALAHFDLLDLAFEASWRGVAASQSGLESLMPEQAHNEDPIVVSFGGLRLYQSSRCALNKMIASLVWTEDYDSIQILRILGAEAQIGSGLSDLKAPLERSFGIEVNPKEISREIAIAADATLFGSERQRLRKAFVTLDKLREIPKVSERGLLTMQPIGPMPKYRKDGQLELPLPPQLAVLYETLAPNERVGLRAAYCCAVASRLFDAADDIAPSCLIEPKTIAKISGRLHQDKGKRTTHIYLTRVIKAVLDHDPLAKHPDAWEELKRAAVRAGYADPLDPLHFLKNRCAGCAPLEITQKQFDEILRDEDLVHNRARLRKAAKLLNMLRAVQDEQLRTVLPAKDLLIPEGKKKPAPKAQCPPPDQWHALMDLAKAIGLQREKIHALGAIRNKAVLCGLTPPDLTHNWACETLAGISAATSRDRFRRGVECLDAIRASTPNSDFLHEADIGPLPDKRRSGNVPLPEHLVGEIKGHAAFRGLSHNATRSILTAITTIFNHTRKKETFKSPLAEIPFGGIVDQVLSETNELPRSWPRISAAARQLEVEVSFHWADDWAELQRQTVAAGVPVKENPVPAVAAVAQTFGLSPRQITNEWAHQYAQTLRPDLRLTWLKRIDRLRRILLQEHLELATGEMCCLPAMAFPAPHPFEVSRNAPNSRHELRKI